MSYRIGETARRVGMTVEGLRFYERRGLVAPTRRPGSGYRIYDERQVGRLRFVKAAQEMGFSLGEIRELLALREGEAGPCREVRARLDDKLATVRGRMRLLAALERDLAAAICQCDDQLASGGDPDCPVLEGLGEQAVAASRTSTDDA